MILASLTALTALAGYALLCAVRPFTPAGKVRLGRRALTAWRHTHHNGTR